MAKPLAGYPQSNGAKRESVVPISGSASYVAVVTGTPPTGGQSVPASAFGLKFFDHIAGGLSDDGQYIVTATLKGSPGKATSAILLWAVAHTGAEAANGDYSARSVALRAIGY